MNRRIQLLLSEDHTIGHSYLMNVRNLADLKAAFAAKILPQLAEHFPGHLGRIGQILGPAFVKPLATTDQTPLFTIDGYDESAYSSQEQVFRRINEQELQALKSNDFKNIYSAGE
jgi:5-methylcytosine-specific restriction protein B